MSAEISGDYERVTVVLRRKDGQTRTIDLDGSYQPLGIEWDSTGHAVDVTSSTYVELRHVATTTRIKVSGTVVKPTPWRFDVPEVPARVTAMEVEGCLIVRVPDMPSAPGGWWKQRFSDGTVDNAKPLSTWLQFAPLVECPDPRAAS
jgi:hypothetical protein